MTIANLEPHKSQADVIRALALLAPTHPRLRYVLVGKGPQRETWSASRRSSGSPTASRFTGALPHEEARAELARGHVHVMPSVHDGFGAAHIEAMAAGVPTIARRGHRLGGHRHSGGGGAARAGRRRRRG